ncbi:hypothetical protein, partial [Mesorhizobium sp. M2A.F.Ca.ET.039.01.1.1]|uniref:hypothetical protein n=1 Tax=Mesorhizobium sp. M2A.F.Ca.ET.039.01.1.1 TaxID=2496746 RepID=UPI000FF5C38A
MQRLAMTFFLITALFATSGAFGDDKDVLADAVKRHICPGNAIKYRMLNVGDECKREFGQCDNLEMGTKVWYACMDEYSKRQRQCWNEVDKRNEIILAYNRLVDDCVNKKNAELLNQNKLTKPSTSGNGSSQSDDQYTYKERLSRAENNLQSAYQKLLKTVKDPKELSRIREDQSAFLARRNRCTTVVCMDDAYTTRIEEVLYETRVAERMRHPADQDSDDPLA